MTESYSCRFCFEESENRHNFIVPCLCKGSQKYVHRDCLNLWLQQNTNTKNYDICASCKGKYKRNNNKHTQEIENAAINETHQYTVYLTLLFVLLGALIYAFPSLGILVFTLVYFICYFSIIFLEQSFLWLVPILVIYLLITTTFERKPQKIRGPAILTLLLLYIATIYASYTYFKDIIRSSFRIKPSSEMYDYELKKYIPGII